MWRRAAATSIVAMSVMAALAACGGPSKSDLLTEGDEICRTSNAPLQSTKRPTNYPELTDAARAMATASDDQAARLRKLGVPDGDKDQVRSMLSAIAGVGASARRVQEAAARTDDKATSEGAAAMATASKDAAVRARAYGFTACGVGSEGAVTTVFDGAKGVVKAAFVARAEGLCKEAINQEDAIREPRSESALPAYLDSVLALEEKAVEQMRGLAVPPGDEATVAELIDARAKLNAKGRELSGAMRAKNDRQEAAVANEVIVLATAAAAKADAYGIRECGTASLLN